MTTISSTTNTTSALTAGASSGTDTGNDAQAMQDRFLKLLVAQINNQDPMNPMDNAQMTTQMAQINTVNGIQQLNQTMSQVASQLMSMQVLQSASMVGRSVLTPGSALPLDPTTKIANGAFSLSDAADNVKIEVLSPGGQVLDTLNSGALGAGRHSFNWDGSNYQLSGTPSYRITATRGSQPVAATAYTSDKVLSVGAVNGALSIELQSGKTVGYSDIAAIL